MKKRVGNVQHRFSTRVAAIMQRRCMFLLPPFSVASRKHGWILGQNIFVKFPVKVTESIVNFRPVWQYWGLNSGNLQKIPFCCSCWASKLLKKTASHENKKKILLNLELRTNGANESNSTVTGTVQTIYWRNQAILITRERMDSWQFHYRLTTVCDNRRIETCLWHYES